MKERMVKIRKTSPQRGITPGRWSMFDQTPRPMFLQVTGPYPSHFGPAAQWQYWWASGLLTMFNIRTIVCYSCVEQVYNTAPLSPTHCGLARGQNKCILNQLFIHVLRQLKIGPVLISISAYISSCNQLFYFFLSMSSSVQCVCFDCNCGVSVVFIWSATTALHLKLATKHQV